MWVSRKYFCLQFIPMVLAGAFDTLIKGYSLNLEYSPTIFDYLLLEPSELLFIAVHLYLISALFVFAPFQVMRMLGILITVVAFIVGIWMFMDLIVSTSRMTHDPLQDAMGVTMVVGIVGFFKELINDIIDYFKTPYLV